MEDWKAKLFSNMAEQEGPMDTPCWMWTGYTDKDGYGRIWVSKERRFEGVHRLAHELWIGPIPEGEQVNHHCDRPGCFRPEHIYAGTAGDNTRDMYERGRDVHLHGEDSPNAELTWQIVNDIRSLGLTAEYATLYIQEEYGIEVSQGNVDDILGNRRWFDPKYVPMRHQRGASQGANNKRAVLNETKVAWIKYWLWCGEKDGDIASRYNVTRGAITSIRLGRSWPDVPIEDPEDCPPELWPPEAKWPLVKTLGLERRI